MVDIFDKILLSDNVRDDFYYNYQDDKFKQWIYELLPEVEACAKVKQDTPWHIYNCLDHILVSVDEMNKQTKNLPDRERRRLAYVMFFHDIGKPECYIRRYSSFYGREVDSFFYHNKASVKIAERVLGELHFNGEDIKEILALIDHHDMFMFITLEDDGNPYHQLLTEKYLKDKVKELNCFGDGEKLLRELLFVGRADNMAQNLELTKDSLLKIDVMEEMLNKLNSIQEK